MRRLFLLALVPFVHLVLTNGAPSPQADDKPLSKEEIIAMVHRAGNPRFCQGELVEQILHRRVSFELDSRIVKELRKGGAQDVLIEAIRHAIEGSNRPETNRQNERSKEETPINREAANSSASLLEETRRHALEFASELPNFVVTQLVTRFKDTRQTFGWELRDKLEIKVTYSSESGEEHRLVRVNGGPAEEAYDRVGGSTSTGEFGPVLTSAFAPRCHGEFRELRHDTLNGRDTVIYDFRVQAENSASRLTDRKSNRTIIAAYRGSVWIDIDTRRVLRIKQSNEGIPPNFPLSLSEHSVEYDWFEIRDERYLLPARAEVIIGSCQHQSYTRNVIEFRNYQKFEGKIKIVPN